MVECVFTCCESQRVKVHQLHRWDVTPQEAIAIQKRLRSKVIPRGRVRRPRLIAGADAAFDKDSESVFAVAVVLSFPALEILECVSHIDHLTFPYVPGLLSFREAPTILRAFGKLRRTPDVIFVDGQGLAHPRAFGIACHIGVCLDHPVIGCAKSVLIGSYEEPKPPRGSESSLYGREGRVIGAAVRTRDRIRPVFVSVGHRISLKEAIRLTLACGKGYRIPEPTRLADHLAAEAKRERR